MIDVASTALGVAIGSMLLHGWRILTAPDVAEAERRVSKLEELVKKLKVTVATKKPPSAGAYRTAPVGDPNTESPLLDPAPPTIKRIFEFDSDLKCPICSSGNRFLRADKDGLRAVNTKTHTSCNGCDVEVAPHLHVTCWACKFKYAVEAVSDSEEEEKT